MIGATNNPLTAHPADLVEQPAGDAADGLIYSFIGSGSRLAAGIVGERLARGSRQAGKPGTQSKRLLVAAPSPLMSD
jgi:hypothetical protein